MEATDSQERDTKTQIDDDVRIVEDISHHSENNQKVESDDKKRQNKTISGSNQNGMRTLSPVRSRSPIQSRVQKGWRSANAFINFVQEFRKDHIGKKNSYIFKVAGERWREMNDTEKRPFIDAANRMKKLKNKESNERVVERTPSATIETKKTRNNREEKNSEPSNDDMGSDSEPETEITASMENNEDDTFEDDEGT